jgi:glycosyl transferase family (putative galactosyltransferase)
MKITLVSSWDDGHAEIAALAMPNRQAYCDRWGYELMTRTASRQEGHWQKIPTIQKALQAGAEWSVWMDSDLIITNPDIGLETVIHSSSGLPSLILSHDMNGINNGVLFFRNCPWTDRFLKLWSAARPFYAQYPNPEQSALAHILYREPKEQWDCRPQHQFNSYRYELSGRQFPEGQWLPGDFILHFAGLPYQMRLTVMREHLAKLP